MQTAQFERVHSTVSELTFVTRLDLKAQPPSLVNGHPPPAENSSNNTDQPSIQHPTVITVTDPEAVEIPFQGKSTPKNKWFIRLKRFTDYVNGVMPAWSKLMEKYAVIDFFGAAQVMFMNNSVTGIFVFAAIFAFKIELAGYGALGLFITTLTAIALGVKRDLIRAGLFGFNGILVGLALATFLDTNAAYIIVLCIIWSSFVATIIQLALGNFWSKFDIPGFTMPFNLSTIIFLAASYQFSYIFVHFPQPTLLQEGTTIIPFLPKTVLEFFEVVLKGVGQVFLLESWISGLLLIIGCGICSPLAAFVAFMGSFIGTITALALGTNTILASAGLFGYNSTLAAMAIGGVFFVPSISSFLLAIACAITSTVLQACIMSFFAPFGIPTCTLPFVLSATMFVITKGSSSRIIAVPMPHVTIPEAHWYHNRHGTWKTV